MNNPYTRLAAPTYGGCFFDDLNPAFYDMVMEHPGVDDWFFLLGF